MSTAPPVKPPRGIKPTKEIVSEFFCRKMPWSLVHKLFQTLIIITQRLWISSFSFSSFVFFSLSHLICKFFWYSTQSGLLISVIRALSASETNEQREVEKAKLEKEYKRSDQRLDELVSLHEQDLTEVMKVCTRK